MPKVIILAGLPGTGKSTKARELSQLFNAQICSADDYFIQSDGSYKYNPDDIAIAHRDCYLKAEEALIKGKSVIIDNTNTRQWERQKYIDLARQFQAIYVVIAIPWNSQDLPLYAERNLHGVPLEKIQLMAERWEPVNAA